MCAYIYFDLFQTYSARSLTVALNQSFCFSNIRDEQGNAILEFAVILPLLFVIIFGTVEFSRLFGVKEFQTLVTREAASIAFRHCFERSTRNCDTSQFLGFPNLDTTNTVDACISRFGTEIDNFIATIFPGSTLTISFYSLDEFSRNPVRLGITTRRDSQVVPTRSNYNTINVADPTGFGLMLDNNEVMVIAEVFFEYRFTLIDLFIPNLELYHVAAY